MRIRRKPNFLVLFTVGFAFLFLLTGSITYIVNLREQSELRMSSYLQDSANHCELALNLQIQSDCRLLESIAAAITAAVPESEEDLFSLLLAANPEGTFLRIGIAGPDGQMDMIAPDGQVYRDIPLKNQSFFQTALSGRFAVSEIAKDAHSGEYTAYCAVPVYETGHLTGVLCGVRSDAVLRDILSTPITSQNGVFLIVDAAGTVIVPGQEAGEDFARGSNLFAVGEFSPAERDALSDALLSGITGGYAFSLNGIQQFAALEPMGINDWTVVGLSSFAFIAGYYDRSLWNVAMIIVTSSGALLLLIYWQTRETRKGQDALERLAYVDVLTDGWNFEKFRLEAERELAENPDQRFAVWTFDVKNFTLINDLFGIAKGDQALCRIHSVLSDDAPEQALLCRIGSDMFAGIRPYADHEEIRAWFRQVCTALSHPEVIKAYEVHVESVMGVYCTGDFPGKTRSIPDMVNRASAARREAKAQVGNVIEFFTKEMLHAQKRKAVLESSAKTALANGEITFFLQPKVGIQEGYRLTGAEALARWNFPGYGWIRPDLFIPLFERNGFIVEVDRYIFSQVCQWFVEHKDTFYYPLRLAVNVSRQGLLRDDMVSYYAGLKEQYGIDDGVLELEFTESMVFNDRERFRSVVTELQQHGFVCTIDDFGAGYSSLNVLRILPIDALKLDAEFFRGDGDEARDQIVVENFIVMAKQLSIRTVAEGVESPKQVSFLREIGCDVVQGYVFFRPLSQAAFQEMLEETGGILSAPAGA